MPIYEYHCGKCGEFDVMQKITEKPLRKCPTCKSKVQKLISSTAFQLKGTGWYVTDYANKGKKSAASDSGGGSPSTESGSTDSTPSEKKVEEKKSKGEKSKSESAAA